MHLFCGIVFKHSRDITIVLLWSSIVHYSNLYQYFFIDLLSSLKIQYTSIFMVDSGADLHVRLST